MSRPTDPVMRRSAAPAAGELFGLTHPDPHPARTTALAAERATDAAAGVTVADHPAHAAAEPAVGDDE